jgi:hypothetical protein
MIYHSVIGFLAWLASTLVFRFYGQTFFNPDMVSVIILFVVAAPVLWGFMVLYLGILKVYPENRALAAIGFALPGITLDALVTPNFTMMFPNINPVMDGIFGGFMLWCYGALLAGGYSSDRRAKRAAARNALIAAGGASETSTA